MLLLSPKGVLERVISQLSYSLLCNVLTAAGPQIQAGGGHCDAAIIMEARSLRIYLS